MNRPGQPPPQQSRQQTGIALLPASVVRGEQLQLAPSVWEALAVADRSLGALEGYARALPDPESFAELMLLRESVRSNHLQGGQATLADLLWWRADQGHEEAVTTLRGELRVAANYVEDKS